jgi:large subunit ribosomal protein L35
MPKQKTRKAVAKRFKLTKRGKIKRSRAFSGHIMTKKSSKRKRFLRGKDLVSKSDRQKIKRQMPYW